MNRDSLGREDAAHLLRRLCFGGSRDEARALTGKSRAAAFEALWSMNHAVPDAALHTLPALDAQAPLSELRQQWVSHIATTRAGLRENLTLFFHGLVGSSTSAVKDVRALASRNALLRRESLGTVPRLLEALVLDPAMMIQIGMNGHGVDRVSDRPAKLILEHWTVGAGHYTDRDMEELSRALTGWKVTESGTSFDRTQFDAGIKSLYGLSAELDAKAAVGHVARQEATARRISQRLLRHFGVVDSQATLQQQLSTTYENTEGSMHALLQDIVTSDAFWADESRGSLIKSPVHLVASACREFELGVPPAAPVDAWLSACGQTLFDTPNNGEGGWKDQEAWITPPDRLAIRYALGDVLNGEFPALGFSPAPPVRSPVPTARSDVRRRIPERVRRTLASLPYQLA